MSTDSNTAELVERFQLKAFVESCLVLEEDIATLRDIDLGMMAGAGIMPPPFQRADQVGLDVVLEQLQQAEDKWGEDFESPVILERLVNQGRLGVKSGQGFYPYPQPDSDGFDQPETVQLQTIGSVAIAWLNRPPMNSISPQLFQELERVWNHVEAQPSLRVLVIASANPMVFSAGADIKAFTKMDAASGKKFLDDGHALLLRMSRSSKVTIAAINGVTYGGGCELVMGCDLRLAADSAMFAQPEINLGIMPGLGGTQRLPKLVGPGKALEMNLTGEAISAEEAREIGLVNRVVPDHELFDSALAWARKLAAQPPRSVQRIKSVSAGRVDEAGIKSEVEGFSDIFTSDDAREGIAAFIEKRQPNFTGA